MTDTECAALMTEWERLEAWGDGAYYGFVAWMRKHGPAIRERLRALEAENKRLRRQLQRCIETRAELHNLLSKRAEA